MNGMCLAPFRIRHLSDEGLAGRQVMRGMLGRDTSVRNRVCWKGRKDQRPTTFPDR